LKNFSINGCYWFLLCFTSLVSSEWQVCVSC
jgi:hypothetical protein